VMVIFLFLRNLSATIIPSLALPFSIVGTFAVMWMFGYSIDNLSLMALTLSVGFVVDDAIVMLENIVRHVEQGAAPYDAALAGSQEVGFTILSMTASLTAVFIPVLFMGGIVGRLLHEFAVTIVIAIVVSGVISVTLTPMLCSRMIRPAHKERARTHGHLFRWRDSALGGTQRGYARSLRWSLAPSDACARRVRAQPNRHDRAFSRASAGLPSERGHGSAYRVHRRRHRHLVRRDEPASVGSRPYSVERSQYPGRDVLGRFRRRAWRFQPGLVPHHAQAAQ